MKKKTKEGSKKSFSRFFKKSFACLALAGVMVASPMVLAGCSAGKDGKDGVMWYTGQDSPFESTGKIGDLYYDTDDCNIYQKSEAGWVIISNIKGSQGQTGPIGPIGQIGPAGLDGATWLSGNGGPAATLTTGKNGDFYLNTENYDIYKNVSGNWTYIGNIKGADADGGNTAIEWDITDDYMADLNSIINSIAQIKSNEESHTVEFIAFTDLHKDSVDQNPEFARMIQALNYLTYNIDVDFVVDLGDNVTTPVKGRNYNVYEQIIEGLESLNAPYMHTVGNHDTIPHIYRRNYSTNIEGAVFDDVGSWFYYDNQKAGVRFIVLDSQDQGNDANRWTSLETGANVTDRSWKQLDWLANTALKTDKKVIVLEHQSLGSSQANVIASQSKNSNYFIARDILKAFQNGEKGSANYTKYLASETSARDTVTWNFSSQGAGTVLFNMFGHTHGDLVLNKNTTISSPFNEISIDNALYNSSTYIGTSASKTYNTVTEICFDVVSVDLLANTVKTFRFGGGADRTIELLDVTGTYTGTPDSGDDGDEGGSGSGSGTTTPEPDGGIDISSQFTWTDGAPVGYATGKTGFELSSVGTNPNLKHSNFISVEGCTSMTLTICARLGTGATGGYCFYTTNDASGFISDGASTRHGNGASADGVATVTIQIPAGAKYMRTTYWSSASPHSSTPFKCVLYGLVNTTYDITFETNGYGTAPDTINDSKLPAELPVLTDTTGVKIFAGWYTDAGLTTEAVAGASVTKATTLYAKWLDKSQTYTITYNINGYGTQPDAVTEAFKLPDTLPTLTDDTLEKHFVGWYTDSGLTTEAVAGATISANTTLYAKWIDSYVVTYNTNGHGTQPSEVKGVFNLPAEFPTLEATGYLFAGWYVDTECETEAVAGASISADTTLYAKWIDVSVTYTITYEINSHGTQPDPVTDYKLPSVFPVLTEAGYSFIGWYTDVDCTVEAVPGALISADTTLYAKWVDAPAELDISSQFTWNEGGPVAYKNGISFVEDSSYSGSGGTNPNLKASDFVCIEGYSTIELTIVARKSTAATGGYCFYTTDSVSGFISDGATTRHGNGATADGVTTITVSIPAGARYIRTTYWTDASGCATTAFKCVLKDPIVQYTLSFNTNGQGETPNSVTTGTITNLPTLTANGYYFTGWYTDSQTTQKAVLGTVLTQNTTLYAGWREVVGGSVDISNLFTWTEGGPVGYASGKTASELASVGTNPNLMYSNYIYVEGFTSITLTICARQGSTATGGFCFYTTNDSSGFISDGASTRHGNGATADGVKNVTVSIPAGAKYLRTTYWSSASTYSSTPFVCILGGYGA